MHWERNFWAGIDKVSDYTKSKNIEKNSQMLIKINVGYMYYSETDYTGIRLDCTLSILEVLKRAIN